MKVLFSPVYITTPHFETELELMLNHVSSGDVVYVLQCNKQLFSCELNPNHTKSNCHICKSKFRKGTSMIANIKILQYPNLKINYGILKDKFRDIEELKNYSIEGINIGLGVASTLISQFNGEHELNTIKYSEEINIKLKTAYYLLTVIKNTVSNIEPDLFYIFNSRYATTLPIVQFCEQNYLPYYTHERAGKLDKANLIYRSTPHSIKYACSEIEELWNAGSDNREQIGASFFIERRNRVTQGWFSHTTNQKVNLLPSQFPKHKTVISIFNSSIQEYAALFRWGNNFRFFSDEYNCLSTIFDFFKEDENIQFYLRIHPSLIGLDNTQTKQLKNYISKYRNVIVISPESKIDTYALIDNSDKIIVLGSTVGAEASYWGKPVIALGRAPYENLDCCYWPNSLEELIQLIKADLRPKEKLSAIKYGYWELARGTDFKYYKPETLFRGKFLNEYISLNKFQKIIYYFLRILELKNLKALFNAMGEKFKNYQL